MQAYSNCTTTPGVNTSRPSSGWTLWIKSGRCYVQRQLFIATHPIHATYLPVSLQTHLLAQREGVQKRVARIAPRSYYIDVSISCVLFSVRTGTWQDSREACKAHTTLTTETPAGAACSAEPWAVPVGLPGASLLMPELAACSCDSCAHTAAAPSTARPGPCGLMYTCTHSERFSNMPGAPLHVNAITCDLLWDDGGELQRTCSQS